MDKANQTYYAGLPHISSRIRGPTYSETKKNNNNNQLYTLSNSDNNISHSSQLKKKIGVVWAEHPDLSWDSVNIPALPVYTDVREGTYKNCKDSLVFLTSGW